MTDYYSLRLNVLDYLRQFAGREVLFYPNPGNGGDSLIASGSYAAFRTCGVNFKTITLDADVRNRIVILGGGGNYIKLYRNIRDAIDKFRDTAAKIIVLPHTILDNDEHIAALGDKFVLFCRDPVSYLHVTNLNGNSEVYLSHDMAFHLNATEFLESSANIAVALPVFTKKLQEHHLSADQIAEQDVVNFNRTDWESVHENPSSFADISEIFKLGVWPENALIASWCMLKAVSLAKSVVSDRLHVCIASALLNKPCVVGDNNFKKVSSVYRHSIRNRFPLVKLNRRLD